MYKGKSTTTFIITLLILLIIGMGVYIVAGNSSVQDREANNPEQNIEDNTKQISENGNVNKEQAPAPDSRLLSCISNIDAEAKKDNIVYEKGSILVTFNQATTQTEALSILAEFNLTLQNESGWDGFGEKKWFVVTVPRGEEFRTICLLRLGEDVKYAGLNQTFDLHL